MTVLLAVIFSIISSVFVKEHHFASSPQINDCPSEWRCVLDKISVTSRDSNYTFNTSDLYELIITSDRFMFIPRNFFESFQIFFALEINAANLIEIEESDFKGCTTSHLRIQNSQIRALPPNVFRNLGTTLKSLKIQNSPIDSIDQNAFQGLNVLELLFLLDTKVKVMHAEIFSPLTQLIVLQISGNKLTELESQLFAQNTRLRRIDISENILHFDQQLFAKLNGVTVLLTHPGAQIKVHFTIAPTIKVLSLTNYDLELVNFERSKLHELDIISGRFYSFDALRSLRTLVLDGSYNTEYNATVLNSQIFAQLNNLTVLRIIDCNVVKIESNVFPHNKKPIELMFTNRGKSIDPEV